LSTAPPSVSAEAAPVGRDDEALLGQRVDHELPGGRHVHPAVQQHQGRAHRRGLPQSAHVVAQVRTGTNSLREGRRGGTWGRSYEAGRPSRIGHGRFNAALRARGRVWAFSFSDPGDPFTMKKIQLGQSILHVTPICLGTMTFGEQVDEPTAHAILDRSLERGVDFLDTAEMYAVPARRETYGATETILGNWFAARPGSAREDHAGHQGRRPGRAAWTGCAKARA
jgi:hypothetical protein